MTINHVQAMTHGWDLPQPPVSKTLIKAIVLVLAESWQAICEKYPKDIQGPEIDVSAHLAIEFTNRSRTDRRLKNIIAEALNGPERTNYNGKSIQKRPDVVIVWKSGKRLSPFIVECKLIDVAADKTVGLYSSKGMARFVDGTYAWSEQEAMMLAFVRDGSSIEQSLSPYMSRLRPQSKALLAVEQFPQKVEFQNGSDVAISRHQRAFAYPFRASSLPGSIDLWHVWLKL
ncbi:hypothetical protein [Agrobacterium arsenijevicii]|uniref:hypothetical protein n=1 Tax=Agrobacterium arsenijevicii TaxID=1585697 RepID=UPI000696D430